MAGLFDSMGGVLGSIRDRLTGGTSGGRARSKKAMQARAARQERVRRRLLGAAAKEPATLLIQYDNAYGGYDEEKVDDMRDQYGANVITRKKKASVFSRLWDAFVNPFTVVLFVLSVISFFSRDYAAVAIVLSMVAASGVLRFVQELRSGNAAEKLGELVETTAAVMRVPTEEEREEREEREREEREERDEREELDEREEREGRGERDGRGGHDEPAGRDGRGGHDEPAGRDGRGRYDGPAGRSPAPSAVISAGVAGISDDEEEEPEPESREIPLDEIVVGDIVHLAAGDIIPADIRIMQAKDLFVSQASLTGESEPVEKFVDAAVGRPTNPLDLRNLAFMGSTVISGSATAIVIAVGDDTALGAIASQLQSKAPPTSFDRGISSVSWLLIRFMLAMVPVVFVLNGMTKGDWLSALLFALSIAVGLTPEMLPMIVSANLAKGAVSMSKKQVVVKELGSIQNFGAMDVLCTDKTGTLTQDRIILEYHLDVNGNEDARVLRHAFLNSFYQTGLKNLMDISIIERARELAVIDREDAYRKIDEIPFDFARRRMSVVVADENGKTQLITKGAIEEMLSISSHVEYDGQVLPMTDGLRRHILETGHRYNADGLRVLGVSQRTNPSPAGAFSVADESDMVLIGYLAFLDPPKESAADAIAALREYGVEVKVLTGDNDAVTRSVCRQVGIDAGDILLGADVEGMDDEALLAASQETSVFAKLSPQQKARVVTALRGAGRVVGYMGDGINDAAAMRASDVGISVDTAVDIAKESANIILMEKDLMALENGVVEGRKIYANIIKYVKMTASSNFGNMLSVLAASAFLPFIPMLPIHLLLLNLIYDMACIAIPWDNVDKEFLATPRRWDASSIGRFMAWIGPTSSVFDITTYLLMFFVLCPAACGGLAFGEIADPALRERFVSVFQAGWFVESMWSQTLVIHMIRTPKIPFFQSRASAPVTSMTLLGIALLTVIPFTPVGATIGLSALPPSYFGWLGATILLYMALATLFKKVFVRRYGELL